MLVPLLLAAEENKNPVLADVNLAIAFSDVKQKNPVLADVNLGTSCLKNILFVYMLFIIKFFFLFIIAFGDVMKNPFNKFKLI